MPDVFGLNIAEILESAVSAAGGLRPATLIKVTPGTRTAGSLADGTNPIRVRYQTQGIVEPTSKGDWNGQAWDMTRRETVTVTLLGAPLTRAGAVPESGDLVEIEGATYALGQVTRDPAAATYSCTAAGA